LYIKSSAALRCAAPKENGKELKENIMAKAKQKAGTALVSMKDLEKLYATDAKASLDTEPMGGAPIIRTRGKKFKIDETVLKAPLQVVVLGTSLVNAWYDNDYDPETPGAPACTAIGEVGKEAEMAPPDSVPKKQHETCRGCPQAAFGTADKGRGKACKNSRRVAVIGMTDDRPEPQVMLLNIPPTGLRKFSAYVKQIASVVDRPLHGVITSFDFDEDQDWPCPVPTFVKAIDNVALAQKALKARERAMKELLFSPIDTSGYIDPAAKKAAKGKAKAGKAPAKKRKF
jgi:hypothetical protein